MGIIWTVFIWSFVCHKMLHWIIIDGADKGFFLFSVELLGLMHLNILKGKAERLISSLSMNLQLFWNVEINWILTEYGRWIALYFMFLYEVHSKITKYKKNKKNVLVCSFVVLNHISEENLKAVDPVLLHKIREITS